jgi:intein/homing endonuclease
MRSPNPFEFDGAPNLSPQQIRDWFIDDYSYARFIQSTRNVLLLGQRGSGKSMTIMYFSLPVQIESEGAKRASDSSTRFIGVYIPCNTPLTHKREYLLFKDPVTPAILSEHYFVLGIALKLAETIELISKDIDPEEMEYLRADFEDLFDQDFGSTENLFRSVRRAINKELRQTQEIINKEESDSVEYRARTFYTLVIPIMSSLKEVKAFKNAHFLLMIDDAHDLNEFQRMSLNSWLSYRDHSLFSLKVAIAKVSDYDFRTASGGTILEGHDYTSIDLEQPFQNYDSRFGKLAREIVERRLKIAGIDVDPDEFFPESEEFAKAMENCNQKAEELARKTLTNPTAKNVSDYRYKQARALYFRSRSSKANRPVYSGMDTIVHLSTGVIRNLLDPCYWMYDDMCSRIEPGEVFHEVPPAIQSEVILRRSEQLWEKIRRGLDKEVEGCTNGQARKIFQLFENLGVLFRERLLKHKSEPRVVTFSISSRTERYEQELKPLIDISRRAQLLYVRSGNAKDDGKREDYFTPNRMLWPALGLDAHGQHGRISLPEMDILAAADGRPFPYVEDEGQQGSLFS